MTKFIDQFAEDVWSQTYKDHNDNTIDDTLRRVSKAVASVEETDSLKKIWEDKFYNMLSDFKATTGGRIYSNAGTEWMGTTLLNCFVSPRNTEGLDSMKNIVDDIRNQIMTLKSEGGWGQDFSWIRPRGTFISSIGVETPGAVKFMEIYDKCSEVVTAGSGRKSANKKAKGKIRKGAMMGAMACWHPDIIEFITAKQNAGRLTKFNISVNCTDKFMEKVIQVKALEASGATEDQIATIDGWDLIYPDVEFKNYNKEWTGDIDSWIAKEYPIKVYQTVSVRWLWNLIMESTYNRAEPGVLFLDKANEYNPGYYMERIVSTNPCLRGDSMVTTTTGDVTIAEIVERFNRNEEQYVNTYNITTGQVEVERVTNALLTAKNREILELRFDDGKVLHVTPDHKIFTKNRGYVEAQHLTEDDDFVSNP